MKRGFTLLEIIFVIVIVGILSSVLLPRFTRPTLQEAANQIVSHIQYTQHLAMIDNKFDPEDEFWYRNRWQIDFRDPSGKAYYTIYQDLNHNGSASTVLSKNEIAKNPQNSTQMMTTLSSSMEKNSKDLNLIEKYNISSIEFSSSCTPSQRISFDYLGRPLRGDPSSLTSIYSNRLIKTPCIITLSDGYDDIKITIEPETGYIHTS